MKSRAFDHATVSAAEALAGLTFTEAEREQLLDGLEGQIERFVALRELDLANDLAPATVFDPRLPDTPVPRDNACALAPVSRPLPSEDADIAYASVVELAHWLRQGKLTARRLTEIYLTRLERHGPGLECVVTLTPERALDEAERADGERRQGRRCPTLHGVGYVAKDLFDTADIPTTWGAEPFVDRVPDTDAAVIARLREAGAVLLGKVSLGALAYGDVWFGGRTRNPWNRAEGASGSSAGSASAVAAGLAGFALGTETLGSIVSPAMRCGAVGLRPTFGRVSRVGAMALAWSMDKVGPITRTVEDAAAVLHILNGHDRNDPGSIAAGFAYDTAVDARGIRLGYDPGAFDAPAANALDRAALQALAASGAHLVETVLPTLPYDALWSVLYAEAAASFDALTRDGRDAELTRQDALAWPNLWRQARLLPAVELVQASRFRRQVMQVMAHVFTEVDALIAPTMTWPYQLVTNMTGHPALTVPIGFVRRAAQTGFNPIGSGPAVDVDAAHQLVPHGISLWGALFGEGKLLRLGRVLERELGIGGERPPGLE